MSIATDNTLVAGAVTLNGGNLTITGADTINNLIVLSAAATITNANAVTISGALSGAGALTKAGAGTLTLTSTSNVVGHQHAGGDRRHGVGRHQHHAGRRCCPR